jgi:hypothetical protein
VLDLVAPEPHGAKMPAEAGLRTRAAGGDGSVLPFANIAPTYTPC